MADARLHGFGKGDQVARDKILEKEAERTKIEEQRFRSEPERAGGDGRIEEMTDR